MEMTPLKALVGGMGAGCFSVLGNNPFGMYVVLLYVMLCMYVLYRVALVCIMLYMLCVDMML